MSCIVTFGKFKGQPLENVLRDLNYVTWCKERGIYEKLISCGNTMNVNIFTSSASIDSPTPVHNLMQNKFLDKTFVDNFLQLFIDFNFLQLCQCELFNKLFNDTIFISSMYKEIFETEEGWDVRLYSIEKTLERKDTREIRLQKHNIEFFGDVIPFLEHKNKLEKVHKNIYDLIIKKGDIVPKHKVHSTFYEYLLYNKSKKGVGQKINPKDEDCYRNEYGIKILLPKNFSICALCKKNVNGSYFVETKYVCWSCAKMWIEDDEKISDFIFYPAFQNHSNYEYYRPKNFFIRMYPALSSFINEHSDRDNCNFLEYFSRFSNKIFDYNTNILLNNMFKPYKNKGIYFYTEDECLTCEIKNIFLELKPKVGDEYPCILRKMKSQIRSTMDEKTVNYCKVEPKYSGKKIFCLLIEKFEAESITREDLKKVFEQSEIHVIFMDEINIDELEYLKQKIQYHEKEKQKLLVQLQNMEKENR